MNWISSRMNEKTSAAGIGMVFTALANIAAAPQAWQAQIGFVLQGIFLFCFAETPVQAIGVAQPPASTAVVAGGTVPALALVLGMTLGLGACSSDPRTVVYDIRAGYDSAFLVPAAKYAKLPPCGPTVSGTCADADVVVTLRKVDADAKAVLDASEATVRNAHAEASAVELAIASARNAVDAAVQILANHGIK